MNFTRTSSNCFNSSFVAVVLVFPNPASISVRFWGFRTRNILPNKRSLHGRSPYLKTPSLLHKHLLLSDVSLFIHLP